MLRRLNERVQTNLRPAILLPVLCITLVTAAILLGISTFLARERDRAFLEHEARVVLDLVSYSATSYDFLPGLQRFISFVAASREIQRLVVIDEQSGAVIASNRLEDIGAGGMQLADQDLLDHVWRVAPGALASGPAVAHDDGSLVLAQRLRLRLDRTSPQSVTQVIVAVRVARGIEPEISGAKVVAWFATAILGVSVVGLLFLDWLLERRILRPLGLIADRLVARRRDRSDRLISMPFPDELASVAGEINATFILNDVQRRELARLAAVAEVTQSAVIVTDPAGAIEWVNASFGRLLGRKLYEVRGQFVLLGLHPAPGQHAVALELWKSLAEKGAVNGELTVLAEDGREVALNLEAQQVLGLEQYVLLCEDITEKRQLERQVLMAASRASEELALGLHDIVGGDLGGLAFQAKVLAEQLDRAGRPEAATARTLIVSLNQLSKRTRAMSHLLAPAMPDTGGLAQALRNMANAAATYCDAYVSTRMPDVVPALEGWRQQQVYLIAQEAVRNAVNHGPPTQLAIAVEEHGGRLDVRVLSKGTAWKPSASAEGLGLHAMRYRARLLDASLRVRTSSAGWTLIAFSVPLPAATGSLPTIGDTARWRQLA